MKQKIKKPEDINENNDKLKALSEEISRMSKELSNASIISIITTDEVIADYLHREWHRNDSTRAGFRILNILTKNGGYMRFTDMSKKVFRSKCAVSRVVDNLEKNKLVKREAVNNDRREKRITITKKGVEYIETTMNQRRQISKKIMSCLNEKEMDQLVNSLRKIKKHILENFPAK